MKISTQFIGAWIALSLFSGCASYEADSMNEAGVSSTEAATDEYSRFVTIYPSNNNRPDGTPILAQRFLLNLENPRFLLDTPVSVVGDVVGWHAVDAQMFAPTPGETAPVTDAIVNFIDPTSPVERTTITDDKGKFTLAVLPSSTGTIQILPNTAAIPPSSFALSTFDLDPLLLDLGSGYPIFGWITDENDNAVPSVEVSAIRDDGLETASTFTDDFGYYQLKVPDGVWTVTAHGRLGERDPTLTASDTVIASNSMQVDLGYNNLDLLSVGGRIVSDTGTGVSGATVTLTSKSLNSYDQNASMTTTVICGSNGYFDTRVLAGDYQIVVTPPEDDLLQTGNLTFSVQPNDTNLPDITLNAFIESLGLVTDSDGAPIPSTAVTLQETQGLQRKWTVYSDKTGLYYAMLPIEPIRTTLTPPENNLGLATTLLSYTPIEEEVAVLPLANGYLLTGKALGMSNSESMPLEYAWVEITNVQGDILANTITNISGDFEVRLAEQEFD